jgi:hypothetical protein
VPALRHDRLRAGDHARNRSEEELGEVDRVRAEVAEDAEPRFASEEAPRQGSLRARCVRGDPLRPEVIDRAERSRLDQAASVLHGGSLAVVEADERPHSRGLDRRCDLGRLLRDPAGRLLDPDVLSGDRRRERDVPVEVIRHRDAHGLDVRVVDDLPPVRG